MIRKLLFLITICLSVCAATAQDADVKEAEAAYSVEQYDKAIDLYESLIRSYGDSYELFYNLGNAYYKKGRIAEAILNYERALLINPGDGDTRHNLEMAKEQTVDKIEPLQEFFLTEWFRSVQNLVSVDTWATTGIVCFMLLIACLALFFFSKWMYLKKTAFYLGTVMIVIVVFVNIFACNQRRELLERKGAIVFSATVTVKSSPDNSGNDLFVLHEGTKVFIRNSVGEWFEIVREDGDVGWINKKDITII
ncbi:MAG: tetratricopeptide repeat protein [Tannerella sp.]|jgi:tetratricopeptide (TPR) repeat protein|nr:tetratricopeptide repeat protein [Tannerella sp.]